MQEQSEPSSRQTYSAIYGIGVLERNALRALDLSTKETSSSQTETDSFTLLNSRLDEIETRLSALELGLKKLEQRVSTTEEHAASFHQLHF